jgi:hypothetical protein
MPANRPGHFRELVRNVPPDQVAELERLRLREPNRSSRRQSPTSLSACPTRSRNTTPFRER